MQGAAQPLFFYRDGVEMEFGSGSGSRSGWVGVNNESNCTLALSFDSVEYKILAALRASVGFISFLCCIAVVIIIILFKKYRFFSQRLVLNVAVAAMVHSISYSTSRVNYYTVRPIDDPYCYVGGLFNHYTAAVELISIWCAAINIFTLGMFGKNISRYEVVCYVVTYALPVLWFWVPLWLQAYGTTGGWCGIKFLNADCTRYRPSAYIQFGIWYVPLYTSTVVIVLGLFAVAIKLFRSIYRWRGKYDPLSRAMKEALKSELRPLIWYPIIYFLLNIFSVISQIYRAADNQSDTASIALAYLRVLSSPFRGAFIALAFALDKDTRGRLNVVHCKAACLQWKRKDFEAVAIESTTLYSRAEESPPLITNYISHKNNNS